MLRVYFAHSVTKNEMRLKTEYFLKQTFQEVSLLSLSKWGVQLNSEYGLKVNNYDNMFSLYQLFPHQTDRNHSITVR